MGWEWEENRKNPPRRFLTPSIATIVFFVLQFFLSVVSHSRSDVSAAVAVDPPNTTPMQIRVVQSIRPLNEVARVLTPVPDNEAELFQLFSRDGSVIFGEGEVEPVATPAREFEDGEVGVITVDTKLRSAKYRR